MAAAADITAPTLTIHGERDDETPPAHSQRIFAALRGPERLIVVPNADHNHVLDAGVWREIDSWLDAALAPRAPDNRGVQFDKRLRDGVRRGQITCSVRIWMEEGEIEVDAILPVRRRRR